MKIALDPYMIRHVPLLDLLDLPAVGVGVSSVLPLFRWAGPDEDDRRAAVRYWKRAIRITAALGVDQMNSEFNGATPKRPAARPSSGARWKSSFPSSNARACAWPWSRTPTTSSSGRTGRGSRPAS
jgi:hypothetical protein